MKIIKNIWRIICYPLLYLGVQFVVSLIYVFAALIGAAIGGIISRQPHDLEEFIFSGIDYKIPMIISVFAAFLIMFAILRKEWKAERLWNVKNFGPAVLFCLGLGFAMNILTNCVINLLPIREVSSPIDDIVGNNFVIDFFIFSLAAPVLEEIIFRGVVQKRLTKMMNLHSAIILQAFIFGFIHLNFIQGTYAFVLGIIIGYIYHWFDSIWYACAIHVAFNGTSILLLYILGDTEVNLLYLIVISAVLFLSSMATLGAFAKNIKVLPKAVGFNRWKF